MGSPPEVFVIGHSRPTGHPFLPARPRFFISLRLAFRLHLDCPEVNS